MGYCIGVGDPTGDHCCYVQGERCPHLMDNAEIMAWIDAQPWGATKKNAARGFAENISWLCRIGLQIVADVTAARNNRARYEQEFAANADYQAFPAPAWRAVEQASGMPAGSMDCWRWQGELAIGGRSCCYRFTTAECDSMAAQLGITTQAVTIRKAGGRAD